jgi:hypothetical protein
MARIDGNRRHAVGPVVVDHRVLAPTILAEISTIIDRPCPFYRKMPRAACCEEVGYEIGQVAVADEPHEASLVK